MNEKADIYRLLQQHIDRMPIPFPATQSGIELALLRHLFSPEEAEIALALSMIPEPVDKIHKRLSGLNISRMELEDILDDLSKRGSIFGRTKEQKSGAAEKRH